MSDKQPQRRGKPVQKIITLFASELAALIGQNTFKPMPDAFAVAFARNFPAKPIQSRQQSDTHHVTRLLNLPQHQELHARIASCVSDIVDGKTDTVEQLHSAVQRVTNDVQLIAELKPNDRHLIVQHCSNAAMTQFGTVHERQSVQFREKATNRTSRTDEHARRFRYLSFDDGTWKIGGKIDALECADDGSVRIIEVKNRMSRLMDRLPEYERVQVEAYMQIGSASTCDIEQTLRSSAQIQRKVLTVQRDDDMWQDIVSKARQVVQGMRTLAADPNLFKQYQLLASGSMLQQRNFINAQLLKLSAWETRHW